MGQAGGGGTVRVVPGRVCGRAGDLVPGEGARIVPLAAVFGVDGALYGSLLPRYPQIADQVGASAGQFGLALAGIGVGGVTGAVVATWVVRALGGPVRALAVAAPPSWRQGSPSPRRRRWRCSPWPSPRWACSTASSTPR